MANDLSLLKRAYIFTQQNDDVWKWFAVNRKDRERKDLIIHFLQVGIWKSSFLQQIYNMDSIFF